VFILNHLLRWQPITGNELGSAHLADPIGRVQLVDEFHNPIDPRFKKNRTWNRSLLQADPIGAASIKKWIARIAAEAVRGCARPSTTHGIEDRGACLEIALDRRARLLFSPAGFPPWAGPLPAITRTRGVPRLCLTTCSLDHRRSLWSGAQMLTQFWFVLSVSFASFDCNFDRYSSIPIAARKSIGEIVLY
jgi:hypothetical protein